MMDGKSRSSPPAALIEHPAARVPAQRGPIPGHRVDDQELRRRRIRHDIRHELGTIIMLASAVAVSGDVGDASRRRIEALLGETRWLDHLLRRLDEGDDDLAPPPALERVRVDELVREIVEGLRLASDRRVGFTARPMWAHIDPLALWRAVRNVLDNACRIAREQVAVEVIAEDGWTVIQVDDDGPGFGAGPAGLASLGLGIVHDLVSGYDGALEIRTCPLGGARVRILLPSAEHP